MDFENVFCSKTRMKILKLIFQFGQLNPSDVASRLKISYKLALKHLELLQNENIVQHRPYGRMKFFRFTNTPKATATANLLEEWQT